MMSVECDKRILNREVSSTPKELEDQQIIAPGASTAAATTLPRKISAANSGEDVGSKEDEQQTNSASANMNRHRPAPASCL